MLKDRLVNEIQQTSDERWQNSDNENDRQIGAGNTTFLSFNSIKTK